MNVINDLISFVFIAICFPSVNQIPRCHLNPLHFNNYWKSVMLCALVIWNQTQIILLGEIIFILQVKIRNSWQFTPQSLDSKSWIHEWCIYVYTCIHTQVSVCTIYGFVSVHNRNQWNMNWFTDALLLHHIQHTLMISKIQFNQRGISSRCFFNNFQLNKCTKTMYPCRELNCYFTLHFCLYIKGIKCHEMNVVGEKKNLDVT